MLDRLDAIEATARETLATVRGILALVAPEAEDRRPRLDELLAEVVVLQRDTLRQARDNAAALARLAAALLPPEKGARRNGHAPDRPAD